MKNDSISRQDALDVLDEFQESVENGTPCYAKARAQMCNLPPTQPEPEELDFVQPHKKIGVKLKAGQPEIIRCKDCLYGKGDIFDRGMWCELRTEYDEGQGRGRKMTNAEAIETLRANYPDDYYEQLRKAVDKAIKALEAQEWIPCSERLPEKDTRFYLVTIANHGLNFTTTLPDDVDVIRWDYDRRKGHNSWHWCTERTVIAWMPLPKAYREDIE